MVKRATSLFNLFCSNVARQVARFLLPVFPVPKINDSPRFTPKSNLEEFVWRYQSITGLISQRQFAAYAGFWYVGLLDVVLSKYLDKAHNFTNLIFYDVKL